MTSIIEECKQDEITLGSNLISIHRPVNPDMFGGYSSVFRSEETRAIDKEFGLDGSYVLRGEFMSEVLMSAVSSRALGNHRVASTLEYFMGLAIDSWGVMVGVEENQLVVLTKTVHGLNNKIFIRETLEFGFLARKKINGEYVVLPSNIRLIRN